MLLEDLQAREIEQLREEIARLKALLAPPGWQPPVEWSLTFTEGKVFAFLLTRDMATKQQIMDLLYWDRPNDEPEIKIVDVFICKMRKKLTPFGVQIATVWGQGYGVPDRMRYVLKDERVAA